MRRVHALAQGALCTRKPKQDIMAEIPAVQVSAIHENDDTEPILWNEADVARSVVEAAVLVDDRPMRVMHLPSLSLAVRRFNWCDLLMRELDRLRQRGIDRQFQEMRSKQPGHIPQGGKHLSRSRPMIVALHVPGLPIGLSSPE
jgi:hypothetical protein